jgi:uncharacterized protein (DUF1697 family)
VTASHVALIRGINVGGKNIVPMASLRTALTVAGFDDVRTYIQSGNAVVTAPAMSEAQAAARVEEVLEAEFGVETVVVAVSAARLREVVDKAPKGFGTEPERYHYDVCFLHSSVASSDAVAAFSLRDGVDAVWEGDSAVYFRRLSARRTESRLSSVMGSPVYKHMTVRNWRTTTKLLEMLNG